MEYCYGVLISVLLTYPQLYPGYVMPEEKLNLGPVKLTLGVLWIIPFLCVAVPMLMCFLFWGNAWFHKKQR